MVEIKIKALLFFLFISPYLVAQTTQITGVVVGGEEVENIHVINKTSKTFATTNKLGGFEIEAKILDTLVFSSIKYKLKAIEINANHIRDRRITVFLEEQVNILDEVVVGKILTGQLDSDVMNADKDRDLDFYDVGIPGYTGKTKTQTERRYFDADNGSWFNGLSFNFYKFLNKVSGRTKLLKERVRKEHNTVLLNSIKDRLSDDFFKTYPLEEELRTDFFYFCSEDPNFERRCNEKSDIEVFEFLAEKIVVYKANLAEINSKN